MSTVHPFQPIGRRALCTSLLILLIGVSASAYTVVLRDGRRLEIPSRFVVTPSTLTYEVQSGIQVTLQMATINVAATEKANNEPAGALMRRVAGSESVLSPPGTGASARKTITNRDLEAAARRRVASEQAYERRLKELGLPSLAESRRQAEERTAVAQAEIHERLVAEKETEGYWRARSEGLRTELAVLDAEIGYVRARLDELPYQGWSSSFTTVSPGGPFISFGNFGRGGHFGGFRRQQPLVYSERVANLPRFGPARGTVLGNQRQWNRGVAPRIGVGIRTGVNSTWGTGGGVFPGTVFGVANSYDYSYERSELITRFNDLAASKAALNARLRELDDEARRAGVPPGWLRR